ncbi:hypothetical protein [Faecalibacterium duncaniae]|uniref:hypothetical protein n=1 Tax=Faecalibacterium duncaniae (strain DSM 17677 / JCM 31915 / A2-165) TaxID=411483 RepID=UPI003ED8DEFD
MHKEVDFIAEYNEEMKELLAEPQTPPSEREWQRFRLSMELVNTQESQYTRIKNEECWKRLEQEFYPALCMIAQAQGGRVELNIEEDTLIGQLVYIGAGLTLGSSDPEGLAAFSRIVSASEDIFVSTHDGCSKFQFIFCLYDKVFVEDHAEQIAEIKEKIRLHRMEIMRLHRIFSEDD